MRVCVIGSGISGIAAIRELVRLASACQVDWISADADAGGLWTDSATGPRLYESLHLNTSRARSAFSGTTIEAPGAVHFLHHSRYRTYLEAVARKCVGVERHWQCAVTEVAALPSGRWLVRWATLTGTEREGAFDAVIDASGHNGEPVYPRVPTAEHLAYEFLHSSTYRDAERFRGRTVLVVGSGASAVDIAGDLVGVAATVTVSIRTPKWHLPKMFLGRPVDQSSDTWWQHLPGIRWLAHAAAEGVVRRVVGRYRAYGLDEPRDPLAESTPVLSDHFLTHLSHGRLDLRPALAALGETTVRFADGVEKCFDVVVAATGFRDRSPHLPADVQAVLRDGRLGLRLEAPGAASLYLMNRFRCGDAAVRCAEVQAETIARALRRRMEGTDARVPADGRAARHGRVTARILRHVYRLPQVREVER